VNVGSGASITDVATGALNLVGTSRTIVGDVGAFTLLSGSSYTLGGITTAGNVSVAGTLALGGFNLIVGSDFVTTGSGALAMTTSTAALTVTGNALFGGGNTNGLLTQGQIFVSGNFTQQGATNSFASTGTTVTLVGSTAQTVGFANPGSATSHFGNLTVGSAGEVTLLSDVTALGTVTVGSGTLKLNGNNVGVVGSFGTSGTGTLTMQSVGDSLVVGGATIFAGGSTTGLLTSGVIVALGNFVEAGSLTTTSFAPSGAHKTVMGVAAATSLVQFGNPGTGAAGSHFNSLELTTATAGISLNSKIFVDSALIVSVGAAPPKIVGNGNSVTARQWIVQGLTVDNAPMILNEGATGLAQTFNGVAFQGFPTGPNSAILIDVTAAGAALAPRPLQFNTTTLQLTLGTGGLYVRVASSNALGLNLIMAGSNDPTGGFSRSQAIAPATIQYQ
jgi:hypothetical protein